MRSGWTRIFDRSYGSGKQGRDVYVRNDVYPVFKSLEVKRQSNYQLMSLFRSLVSLNADPASGAVANAAATIRNLISDGYAVEYYLDNGDVLVSKIRFSSEFRSKGSANRSGLYSVKRVGGDWQIRPKPIDRIPIIHQWNGSHYAAIAGKFSGSDLAGDRLPRHILKAYSNEILEKDVYVNGNHYSMYWTSGKGFGAQAESDSVASLMQQAADAKASVNWLIHGEGAKTFKKALEILQDSPSLSRFAAADEESVRYLRVKFSKQKVYFSNPKGADTKVVETLCKKVGITYVDSHVSPRNLGNTTGVRNVWKDIQIPVATLLVGGGALAGLGEQASKSLGYSGAVDGAVGLMQKAQSFAGNPTLDQFLPAAAATVGCFILGKAAVNKNLGAYKAVKALMVGTFGSGDEFWYESDDDLLEQMSA